MERKERAGVGLGRGSSKRLGTRFALVAACVVVTGGLAHAAPEADCSAVNRGALNVDLGATADTTRQASLKAGDALTFSFEAAPGPFGTLTLLEGAGAPRSLLVGPTGTSVSFTAARGGAFSFQYSKEGAEAAAFTVSCVPAGSARRDGKSAVSAAARRSAKLLGKPWNGVEEFEPAELPGVTLDAGAPVPSSGTVTPGTVDSNPAPRILPRAAPLDVKLQWQGERYKAGGPDGFEIDNSASGVEAAINYKVLPQIMVGALAQVDQPSETLVGVPHSLSDHGWMAGPVTNVKLAPGLTLDARAAWGMAESAPDELSAHAVGVPRRMVNARLANTQSFGPWRLTPSVTVNHYQEAAAAPALATHDAAVPYAGGFGRVDVGPEIAYRIDLDKSVFVEPRAVIGSFWDFDSLSKLAPGTAGHNDMRLKAEAGVTIGATGGTKLQAAGGVEEGEPGTANVWSGRLQLNVPMQ